jgi:hypothetical protein
MVIAAGAALLLAGCNSEAGGDDASSRGDSPATTASNGPDTARTAQGAQPPTNDVKVVRCERDASSGKAVVTVEVTNSTDTDAFYAFDIEVVAGPNDTPYATTPFNPRIVPGLPPGATQSVEATTTSDDIADPVSCAVENLQRQ